MAFGMHQLRMTDFFEFVASGLFTDEYDRLTDIN